MNIQDSGVRCKELVVPKGWCVYFLTDAKGEVVYVGKSSGKTLGRVATHEYSKLFERVFFVRCRGREAMDRLEAEMVRKATPRYNGEVTERELAGLMTLQDVRRATRYDARVIRNAARTAGVEEVVVGSNRYYDQGIVGAVERYVSGLRRKPAQLATLEQ